MALIHRRKMLGLLGGVALQGCVATPPTVTRSAPDPFEGGIGGTGIVGLLTDFGSLIINGLRVEQDGRTRYATPFGSVDADALAPGQALTVQAIRTMDRLVARSVRIDHALVGVLDGQGRNLKVNGAHLILESGAIIEARPGDRVAVSGVWQRDGLSTSRIDPAARLSDPFTEVAPDLIAGTFDRGGPTGATIGGQPIQLSSSAPLEGSYLVGRGKFDGTVLKIALTRQGRFDANARLQQLSVEGYLEPTSSAPLFRVAGLGHSFGRDLRLDPLARNRAVYFGPYDGRFNASAGYIVSESFSARRAALRDGISSEDGPVIRTRG